MKKKIFAIVLCVAMLAIAVVGGTMAYFTDNKEQTNTFTSGKVEITLDEAAVVKNDAGDLVRDGENRISAATPVITHYGKLYPSQSVCKDPTITVAAGSEDTYIAAKVIVTNGNEDGDLYGLIPMNGATLLEINNILSGGLLSEEDVVLKEPYNGLSPVFGNDEFSIYQVRKDAHTYVFYIFMEDVKKANDKVVLFDEIVIPEDWDNEQMAYLKNLSINVEAYAVQAHGFTHLEKNSNVDSACFEAIKAAFGKTESDPFHF